MLSGGANSRSPEKGIFSMMSNTDYQDRILTCRECGRDFVFSAGEQEFYASKSLTNTPGRCPSCRAARRGGQSPASRQRSGEHYETTCASCGQPTSVPFIPRDDRPVYCSDCFQAQRNARGSRREDSRAYSSSQGGRGRDRDRRDRRDR